MNLTDGTDYRVGYGRPPLHSRFRKGQSGNPAGRRGAGARLAVAIEAALDAPADSGERQGRRRLSRREAIVERLAAKATAGDLRAVRLLFDLVVKLPPPPEPDLPGDTPQERLIRTIDALAAKEKAAAAARRRVRRAGKRDVAASGDAGS